MLVLCCLVLQIYFFQNAEGTGLSPFDSWLLLRGVKTMHIRVEKQQENAIRVAHFLKAHPCTTHVSFFFCKQVQQQYNGLSVLSQLLTNVQATRASICCSLLLTNMRVLRFGRLHGRKRTTCFALQ